MKTKILLITTFICSVITITGQNLTNKFQTIGKDEITYNSCSFDSEAEAVVFFDYGTSYFVQNQTTGFNLIFERTTRIKILKESGIQFAEIKIPLYRKGSIYEKINEIDAYTYNYEDGRINKIRFDEKNIRTEKVNDSWIVKKIILPDVRVGSIVEYKYQVESEYLFNLRDWEFQWEIPVIESEYVVKMIPFYQYSFLLQGRSKFDYQSSDVSYDMEESFAGVKYRNSIHVYGMKNIPAFKEEEFISSKDDYIIKLDFQLSKIIWPNGTEKDIITTWAMLSKELIKDEDFGIFSNKCRKAASKIIDLNSLQSKSETEKFNEIVSFVKNNFHWNNRYTLYASKSLNNLLNDKLGSSADINLLTIGLLNAVGINAFPLIISTRDNGKIQYNYPFVDFFNSVLIFAEIEGKQTLSDATDLFLSNQSIPSNCINDKGLIIQKEKQDWVNLFSRVASITKNVFKINIKDTKVYAQTSIQATNYDALYHLKKYGNDIDALKKNLNEKGYSNIDSLVVDKHMDNTNLFSYKYNIEDKPEILNGKIYIEPFFNEVIKDNPLKLETRTYPIDMIYPKSQYNVAEITIPAGYKIDYLPEASKIENDKFELNYVAMEGNGKVIVSLNYSFKLSVYPETEYKMLKYYFNEIKNKGLEKIVLTKEI